MIHALSISQHIRMNLRLVLQATCLVAAAIAMTSATVGCGNDSNQQGQVVAVTALSNCAAGETYQGNAWARTDFGRMNATPYGYGVRSFHPSTQTIRNEGFCGCSVGTQPMCDSQAGVICMPIEALSGADLALWQPGPQGLNFSGYAGYTAYGSIHDPRAERRWIARRQRSAFPVANVRMAQTNRCASHIGQTCTLGTNSCDQGSDCRPIRGNRHIGICAR